MSSYPSVALRAAICRGLRHAAAAALIAASVTGTGWAATIVVTTTAQRVAAGSPGDCSLQEAIFAVNFQTNKAIHQSQINGTSLVTGCIATGVGDIDTIALQPNAVYQVANYVIDPFNFAGITATPMIIRPVTIKGNGARLERVGGDIRAFVVGSIPAGTLYPPSGGDPYSGSGSLYLQNLHIKGFVAKGAFGVGGGGGGMGAGGAIYTTQPLTIEYSTFEGNVAKGGNGSVAGPGGGGGGGGVSVDAYGGVPASGGGGGGGAQGNGGNGGNNAGGGGGGTINSGSSAGGAQDGGPGGFQCGASGGGYPVTLPTAACAGGGGGGGAVNTNGIAQSGSAGGYGAGGGGGGQSTGSQSNLSHGGAGGAGGFGGGGGGGGSGLNNRGNGGNGGFGGGGGGIGGSGSGGTAGTGGVVGGSAIGSAGGGGAGLGGAIFSDGGAVDVRNTTFYNNAAIAGQGAGDDNDGADFGGAIFTRNAQVSVRNVTISHSSGFGDLFVFGEGGGSTTLVLRNSIMANNVAANCILLANGGSATGSGENNLIPANGGCPDGTVTLDPHLGPLQMNAPLSTPTMRILPSSSAYNAGGANCMPFDQRGVARPQFGACDIGAYEHAPFTLDVDYSTPSTKYDPLTDGLLIMRYMFGLRGTALAGGALGANAERVDPDAIAGYLQDMGMLLDVDGNSIVDPLTDGLLIYRFLKGLDDDGLFANAIGRNATRDSTAIRALLHLLTP